MDFSTRIYYGQKWPLSQVIILNQKSFAISLLLVLFNTTEIVSWEREGALILEGSAGMYWSQDPRAPLSGVIFILETHFKSFSAPDTSSFLSGIFKAQAQFSLKNQSFLAFKKKIFPLPQTAFTTPSFFFSGAAMGEDVNIPDYYSNICHCTIALKYDITILQSIKI